MDIEELREELLGASFIWVPEHPQDDSPESRVALFFHELANQAIYSTWQALEALENEPRLFSRPKSGAVPVMLWFVSIEAFINTILKVFCKLSGTKFENYRGRGVTTRLSAIFELGQLDRTYFQKQGLWARLGEFTQFRNEILHDRFQHESLEFHHTIFSSNPYLSNQADDIQASLIANEIFEALRYVVSGLDLMPNIRIQSSGGFGWFKSSEMHESVTIPFYEGVLEKHELTSKVQSQFRRTLLSAPPSTIVSQGRVNAIICAKPSMPNMPTPNSERTSVGNEVLERVRSSIPKSEGKFVVPNYSC